MNVFQRIGRVRAARLRAVAARQELKQPVSALLARERAHPLTTVGAAAGVGVVLGRLNIHPLRVPGVGALLGGGLAEAAAVVTRLFVDMGAASLAANAVAKRDRDDDDRDFRQDDGGSPHE